MASITHFLKNSSDFLKRNNVLLLIIFLILLAVPLRFKNLDYSDYHGDEYKAFLIPGADENAWQFLLRQRKGPMQFLVSYIPYLVTHNFRTEFAERIPFAIASCLSIAFFFLFVKNITKSKLMAFISSLLFITNGFVSGIGRIAQYQNLNLLFSFAALFFYSKLIDQPLSDKKSLKLSLLGTFFWCLSVLSHWDAILIAPVVIYIIFKSLSHCENKVSGLKVLLVNIMLGLALTLPFIVPYIDAFKTIAHNRDYALDRVGLDLGYSKIPLYKELTELYNPFLTLPFLLIAGLIGVLNFKKSLLITLWFTVVFAFFELFVKHPGTHFYNFLLPLIILSGIGAGTLFNLFKFTKFLVAPVLLVVIAFLYFQTYMLFVDHSVEYPFKDKTVLKIPNFYEMDGYFLNLVAQGIENIKPDYMRGSYVPLFGFTHHRFWNEIGAFVNSQNTIGHEKLKYITNEDKTVSERYMDTKYGLDGGFYAVGIRRPMNFVQDFGFPNYSHKTRVQSFSQEGEVVVVIYKVEGLPQ